MAYADRAYANARIGEVDVAVVDADRAIELDSGLDDGYISRGLARARRGEFDLAIADYDRAMN